MKYFKYLLYYVIAALTAVLIGAVAWSYLFVVNSGIHFLWVGHGEHLGFMYQHSWFIYPFVIGGALILATIYNRYEVIPRPGLSYAKEYKLHRRVKYKEFFKVYILAMGPLMLGSSVGPEASLIGLFFMLSGFIGDITKFIERKLGIDVNSDTHNEFKADIKNSKKYLLKIIVIYGVTAYTLITLLNMDKFPPFNVKLEPINIESMWELLEIIPFILVGWGFAKFYQKSEHIVEHWFEKVQNMHLKLAITGFIVATAALVAPTIILSGEATLHILVEDHIVLGAGVLITLAVAKVMLTHVSISGNLKGGHIFPIIFSAFLLGDGLSVILHTDPTLTIAAVTSAMVLTIFSNLVAVFLLLALFFPVKLLLIIFVTVYFVGERIAAQEERNEV